MPIIAALAVMLTLHFSLVKIQHGSGGSSQGHRSLQARSSLCRLISTMWISTFFIKFMSELTATNFVVDQRVKGKVTIISPSKISLKEAYRVFESVLEVHGLHHCKSRGYR